MTWYTIALSFVAQAESATSEEVVGSSMGMLMLIGIVLGCTVLPFLVGSQLAKILRMPDHGWKIGLALCTVLCGIVISSQNWPPKLGIDLSGGTILIYEALDTDEDFNINDLVVALKRRINPGGVKEVVIRPYGARQVEIIIPDVNKADVDEIKKSIVTAGQLEFLIVAEELQDPELISNAQTQQADALAQGLPAPRVVTQGDDVIGEWIKIDTEDGSTPESPVYRFQSGDQHLTREFRQGEREILMKIGQHSVVGDDLKSANTGYDETMRPAIFFSMHAIGSRKFGVLTSTNLKRGLGVVMDKKLLTAPTIQSTISDRGQITGNFSQDEVDFYVGILKAGKLPAQLNKKPISDSLISPTLGLDTIEKGRYAIILSLAMVLFFMLAYYQLPGIFACIALSMNLLLIVTLMILLKAAFTLPGLAGLVLTVGMSVDANVLIFERIGEEIRRGSVFRMAITNGFKRATTTIIDANLTTLITGIVLYVIGTDQIRGFAVTLVLGILMSMYTAIFCTRIAFDVFERRRWMQTFRTKQIFSGTTINFISKRHLAAFLSLAVIIVGLVGAVSRGTDLFGIDFNGGTSVEVELVDSMSFNDVRNRLEKNGHVWTVYQQTIEGKEEKIYKFDSAEPDIDKLLSTVEELFQENGQSLLVMHSVSFEEIKEVFPDKTQVPTPEVTQAPGNVELPSEQKSSSTPQPDDLSGDTPTDPQPADSSQEPAEGATPETNEESPESGGEEQQPEEASSDEAAPQAVESQSTDQSHHPHDNNHLLAFAGGDGLLAQLTAGQSDTTSTGEDDQPTTSSDDSASPIDTALPDQPVVSQATTRLSETTVTFQPTLNEDTIKSTIQGAGTELGITGVEVVKLEKLESPSDPDPWRVTLNVAPEQAESIFAEVKSTLDGRPQWLSSNKIGSQVAGDLRGKAIAAIIASLVGIVTYIWIRFQRIIFGLAAVVALVHDVLVTLGALAISLWLSDIAGFLLIEEFKITLPVVAAFLTIIGYSLNDTIVVFDRIREVRGKSPGITASMINQSINQTLSRTVLTSLTTLIVVTILYIGGGDSIHAFAFALVVGVVAGTYSSIFVASPVLLWMSSGDNTARSNPVRETTAAS